jgi:hypothetical protein
MRLPIHVSSVVAGGQRYASARAYRGERMVCARVQLTIGHDDRIGLVRYERRSVLARFCEGLDPALRAELDQLVRRRGVAARRIAETLEPLEIVVNEPCFDCQHMTVRLEPPLERSGDLRHIEFRLRELT